MELDMRSAGHTWSHTMVYHPRDSCCSKAQVAPSRRPRDARRRPLRLVVVPGAARPRLDEGTPEPSPAAVTCSTLYRFWGACVHLQNE